MQPGLYLVVTVIKLTLDKRSSVPGLALTRGACLLAS